jgi:pyruvate/2-oxoacid:ferredoxin oxidoreductase alpha subunit
MHELLHFAAGARTPVVMATVNRTLAAPWGFWPDQTDSLAQRDTGWIQLYCASAQEALDSVLVAFRVAEAALVPAMVVIEALYVSHTLEPVEVPGPEVVERFLPAFEPAVRLDPRRPRSFGGTATPAQWRANRLALQAAMDGVPAVLEAAHRHWAALTGRDWGAVESYRAEDAELLLVTAGSIGGTAREAIDRLRASDVPAGLIRLRLFRPFPARRLAALIAGATQVAVIDRNCSPGSGGIVASEVRAALHAHGEMDVPVLGYLAGLGGVDVSVERIVRIAGDALRRRPTPEPILAEAL